MSMLVPELIGIGGVGPIGQLQVPSQQTAPAADLYSSTRALFQGDNPVCMDGVGYELDPKSYVWSEEDDGVRARRGTGPGSFQAQYCPEGKVISPKAETQMILTEPFTGCAFFMCEFGDRQLICHFNNATEISTYEILADELMQQQADAIDGMIEKLPGYETAGDQDEFKEKTLDELRNELANRLHAAIVNFNGKQDTQAHFPSRFMMKSTSSTFEGEHKEILASCTTAVLVKNGDGWSMLTQSHLISDKVDPVTHKNQYHGNQIENKEQGIIPLQIDMIYLDALQACNLQTAPPSPKEMLLIHGK